MRALSPSITLRYAWFDADDWRESLREALAHAGERGAKGPALSS